MSFQVILKAMGAIQKNKILVNQLIESKILIYLITESQYFYYPIAILLWAKEVK